MPRTFSIRLPPLRGDAIKCQPDGRCDVQPLRHAADPEPGFIHVFHWRRRHVTRTAAAKLWNRAAQLRPAGDGRHQTHAEQQIGHQHRRGAARAETGSAVNHDSRDVGAVLHRCAVTAGGTPRAFRAALRTAAGMRAMFRDDQGLWRGQVEHLLRGATWWPSPRSGIRRTPGRSQEMIDRGIGRFGSAQRFARMAFLATGLLA